MIKVFATIINRIDGEHYCLLCTVNQISEACSIMLDEAPIHISGMIACHAGLNEFSSCVKRVPSCLKN